MFKLKKILIVLVMMLPFMASSQDFTSRRSSIDTIESRTGTTTIDSSIAFSAPMYFRVMSVFPADSTISYLYALYDTDSTLRIVSVSKVIDMLEDSIDAVTGAWSRSGNKVSLTNLTDSVGIQTDAPAKAFDVDGESIFRGEISILDSVVIAGTDKEPSHFFEVWGDANITFDDETYGLELNRETNTNNMVRFLNNQDEWCLGMNDSEEFVLLYNCATVVATFEKDGDVVFNGSITADSSIIVGNTTDTDEGSIKYDGSAFYGRNDTEWIRLDSIHGTETDPVWVAAEPNYGNLGQAETITANWVNEANPWTRNEVDTTKWTGIATSQALGDTADALRTLFDVSSDNYYLSAVDASDLSAVDFTITNGTDVENVDFTADYEQLEDGFGVVDFTYDPSTASQIVKADTHWTSKSDYGVSTMRALYDTAQVLRSVISGGGIAEADPVWVAAEPNYGNRTQNETLTGDWDNTANPWTRREVDTTKWTGMATGRALGDTAAAIRATSVSEDTYLGNVVASDLSNVQFDMEGGSDIYTDFTADMESVEDGFGIEDFNYSPTTSGQIGGRVVVIYILTSRLIILRLRIYRWMETGLVMMAEMKVSG